jgi:hypothetical protein
MLEYSADCVIGTLTAPRRVAIYFMRTAVCVDAVLDYSPQAGFREWVQMSETIAEELKTSSSTVEKLN